VLRLSNRTASATRPYGHPVRHQHGWQAKPLAAEPSARAGQSRDPAEPAAAEAAQATACRHLPGTSTRFWAVGLPTVHQCAPGGAVAVALSPCTASCGMWTQSPGDARLLAMRAGTSLRRARRPPRRECPPRPRATPH